MVREVPKLSLIDYASSNCCMEMELVLDMYLRIGFFNGKCKKMKCIDK